MIDFLSFVCSLFSKAIFLDFVFHRWTKNLQDILVGARTLVEMLIKASDGLSDFLYQARMRQINCNINLENNR